MSLTRVLALVIFVASGIFLLVASKQLFEDIEADESTVIQSPVAGELNWYTKSGMVWQGFGNVTAYKKRGINRFEIVGSEQSKCTPDVGIVVRFYDGAHATICGSVQYELPEETDKLTMLHTKYKGQRAVERDLIQTITNKSIYLVGTLMSSKESYAEKRNDLIFYVLDQIQNGVYRTRTTTEWVEDPITKERRQVTKAEIVKDKDGQFERQEESTLNRFGIKAHNFTISAMPYEAAVEKQIQQQQQIAMNVQTSVAEARMAEQRAVTAEQQGRANATEAKWRQETEKAVAVTKAQQEKEVQVTNAERDKTVAETQGAQRLSVASLDRQAAEQYKLQQILIGQGDAERRTLVLKADGALDQKLKTYTEVATVWANAIKGSHLVPNIVIGQGAGTDGTAVSNLISMLNAKTARDLTLDLSIPAQR